MSAGADESGGDRGSDRDPASGALAPRACVLIEHLGLRPHPEGGRFREIHRATHVVRPGDGRDARPALTSIYFLLTAGECSAWHRVQSDEAWHFHEGEPLELFVADPSFDEIAVWRLGSVDAQAGAEPVRVVPAGWWQAARSTGAYTLVSCDVGPGFDFADFTLLRDERALAEVLRTRHPGCATFV